MANISSSIQTQEFEPQFEKVRELFDGMAIPTSEDWKQLQQDVEQYGLYHAYID